MMAPALPSSARALQAWQLLPSLPAQAAGSRYMKKSPCPAGFCATAWGATACPRTFLTATSTISKALACSFICNHPVDVSLELETLAKKHSGVIVATGTWLDRKLGVPGEDLAGVEGCLSFLNRMYRGEVKELQGRAAVIGDGNSAFDLARALCRLGAEVTLMSWFSEDAIPADADEVKAALEEGIAIKASCQVTAFEGKGGKLSSLKCAATKPGKPDAGGICWPVIDPKKPGCELSFDHGLCGYRPVRPSERTRRPRQAPCDKKRFYQNRCAAAHQSAGRVCCRRRRQRPHIGCGGNGLGPQRSPRAAEPSAPRRSTGRQARAPRRSRF